MTSRVWMSESVAGFLQPGDRVDVSIAADYGAPELLVPNVTVITVAPPAGEASGSATIEPAGSAAPKAGTGGRAVSAEDAIELFGATELKDGD